MSYYIIPLLDLFPETVAKIMNLIIVGCIITFVFIAGPIIIYMMYRILFILKDPIKLPKDEDITYVYHG